MNPKGDGKRILCLTKYDATGPSSRHRFSQFLPGLKAMGWNIKLCPLLPSNYVRDLYSGNRWGIIRVFPSYFQRIFNLLNAHNFNFCWIQYELFPWLPGFGEWCFRRLDIPYIVDYDDAIFHNYDRHSSAGVRCLLGSKLDRVMAGAAAVIAGNHYLANRALTAGAKRVEVIPTVVDLQKYTVKSPRKDNAGFTVGWIGSPITEAYLSLVKDALAQVFSGGQGNLITIGTREGFSMEGVPIERVPWSDDSEVASMYRFDVGIMPLPREDAWSSGKCGFKLIQYMGCGLPVVAASVGANRDIVVDRETGFLASTHEEWVRGLTYFKIHPEEGMAMGRAGRLRMEANFSLQSQLPRLDGLFRDILEKFAILRQ